MKISKIFAGMSALAIASAMAVSASAAYEVPDEYIVNDGAGNGTVYLVGDESKSENGPFNDDVAGLAEFVGVKVEINLDETEASDCANGGETWVGGGVGFNSNSTSWESHEWTPKALDEDGNPVKEITLTKVSDGVYEAYYVRAEGTIFAADDEYAQIWMQDWSTKNASIASVTLLTADDISGAGTADPEPDPEPVVDPEPDPEPTADPVPDPEPEAPASDATTTTNPEAGAAASIALAGIAVAGAAFVATKKR